MILHFPGYFRQRGDVYCYAGKRYASFDYFLAALTEKERERVCRWHDRRWGLENAQGQRLKQA
jgi:predicted N-acyltransferase